MNNESSTTATLIVDGFIEDAIICINSILEHSDVSIFLLINGKQDIEKIEALQNRRIRIRQIKQRLGWGNAVNLIVDEVTSEYLVIMDPSTIFQGNPFLKALNSFSADIGAVGWRGGLINIEDEWRTVDDKGEGEVDALFNYFILLKRDVAVRVRANPSAKYYRNADLEFSLAIRASGLRLLQVDLPLVQGRHHGYHDVDEKYRDKNSRENYQRLLKRFRGNLGILAPRR